MFEPLIITAPTAEAVTVDEAKTALRITHSAEDSLISDFIAAATRELERETGRTVMDTTLEVAMDAFPRRGYICLPRAYPLIEIVWVKYKDSEGVDHTWTDYAFDTYTARIAPNYGESWPDFTPYPLSAVRVRYRAGISNTASPPERPEEGIRRCIIQMVGGLYMNRESVVVTDRSSVAAFAINPITRDLLSALKVAYAY